MNTTNALASAAQALIDRWDTPKWKDAPHTAEFINDLRDKLAAYRASQTVAAFESAESRDAERWRTVAHVFHITDRVGERTGQHAVKLSTHWAAWVDGKHTAVTDAVDAYAAQTKEAKIHE